MEQIKYIANQAYAGFTEVTNQEILVARPIAEKIKRYYNEIKLKGRRRVDKRNFKLLVNKKPTSEAEEILSLLDDIFQMEDGDERDFAIMDANAQILRYRVRINPKYRQEYSSPAQEAI